LGGRLEVFFTVDLLSLAKTAELSWAVTYKAGWVEDLADKIVPLILLKPSFVLAKVKANI